MLLLLAVPAGSAAATAGLVGHWSFDDGTGRDRSGGGNDLALGEAKIHLLGAGRACLRFEAGGTGAAIMVPAGSPLAIARGTICFWLNVGVKSSTPVLEYDNRAVELLIYRSHFQPRFRGEGDFRFGSALLGDDWPKFLLRESAFYPHEQAVTGEGEWHHFAVAYDDGAKRISGWRDGELISVVDLSTVAVEPLRRSGLATIAVGAGFSGFLDELRIYDRPLGSDEVRRLHEAEREAFAGRNDAVAASRRLRVYSYEERDRTLYRAWLQHPPLAPSPAHAALARVTAPGADPTVQNAARELAAALGEMVGPVALGAVPAPGPQVILGTPETAEWIRARAVDLRLEALRHDGYVVKTVSEGGAPVVVVAARRPAGVVFGVFDLIRRLQLGDDPGRFDRLENPGVALRMVNHWDIWRGFPHDDWRGSEADQGDGEGNRSNSIYSWEELRRGETRRLRDWARLLASAGWNAVCPTEINWEFRNNFLEHLDEVKTLAGIFREYGITLFWSPNYLLALRRETAERLYAAVPDFGGYLLKLGSEAQEGDPRPAMVNPIADHLQPYGGRALVRAFVYGKSRYSPDDIRNLNPYDVFAPEDGRFRDNVVIVSKGSPLDWDLSAPIPALDGAIRRNRYGSELVIAKHWPLSWVEKWKWWLEQDNYRGGPGSLNKLDLHCLLGVAMIHPAPGWTACPLNMVNYYGLGRLAWNPDLGVDDIYAEWTRLTFGPDPEVVRTVATILLLSDDVTRKLYFYRGYRGVWIDRREKREMVQRKTPHAISRERLGIATPELRQRVLDQYSPGLRAIYGDPLRGEEFFASFQSLPLDHRLASGRSVIADLFANLDEAVTLAARLPALWRGLQGKVDLRRFQVTLESLEEFVRLAQRERDAMVKGFEAVTGRRHAEVVAELAPARRGESRYHDVRDYGAEGLGTGDAGAAFEAALAAAHAAGGGTVFVPAGVYPTSPVRLRSNVTLALETGAILRALAGGDGRGETGRGSNPPISGGAPAALVWGEDLEGVRILGPGTLDATAWARAGEARAEAGGGAIALTRCRAVEVRNLQVRSGIRSACVATDCADLLIDNVALESAHDGIDLARCRDVTVAHCRIEGGHRGGDRPAGGGTAVAIDRQVDPGKTRASANITIRDSYLRAGHRAVQPGVEPAGTSRHIRIENTRMVEGEEAREAPPGGRSP